MSNSNKMIMVVFTIFCLQGNIFSSQKGATGTVYRITESTKKAEFTTDDIATLKASFVETSNQLSTLLRNIENNYDLGRLPSKDTLLGKYNQNDFRDFGSALAELKKAKGAEDFSDAEKISKNAAIVMNRNFGTDVFNILAGKSFGKTLGERAIQKEFSNTMTQKEAIQLAYDIVYAQLAKRTAQFYTVGWGTVPPTYNKFEFASNILKERTETVFSWNDPYHLFADKKLNAYTGIQTTRFDKIEAEVNKLDEFFKMVEQKENYKVVQDANCLDLMPINNKKLLTQSICSFLTWDLINTAKVDEKTQIVYSADVYGKTGYAKELCIRGYIAAWDKYIKGAFFKDDGSIITEFGADDKHKGLSKELYKTALNKVKTVALDPIKALVKKLAEDKDKGYYSKLLPEEVHASIKTNIFDVIDALNALIKKYD